MIEHGLAAENVIIDPLHITGQLPPGIRQRQGRRQEKGEPVAEAPRTEHPQPAEQTAAQEEHPRNAQQLVLGIEVFQQDQQHLEYAHKIDGHEQHGVHIHRLDADIGPGQHIGAAGQKQQGEQELELQGAPQLEP